MVPSLKVGSRARFGGVGAGPGIWVNTSQLLGLVARPWLPRWGWGGGGEPVPPPTPPRLEGEQDVGEAVTPHPSPLSL